jgi:hypothetical protein
MINNSKVWIFVFDVRQEGFQMWSSAHKSFRNNQYFQLIKAFLSATIQVPINVVASAVLYCSFYTSFVSVFNTQQAVVSDSEPVN